MPFDFGTHFLNQFYRIPVLLLRDEYANRPISAGFLALVRGLRLVGSRLDCDQVNPWLAFRVAIAHGCGIVALSWWLLFDRGWTGLLGWRFLPASSVAAYGGLALTTAGLALAVWARFYIGGNWSALVELKKDHQLIRRGPYAIVRHPIYSGFMLATLGTAVMQGELHGLLALTLIVTVWGYKSGVEERFLMKQFGGEYEQYRRRFKGLIPFVR